LNKKESKCNVVLQKGKPAWDEEKKNVPVRGKGLKMELGKKKRKLVREGKFCCEKGAPKESSGGRCKKEGQLQKKNRVEDRGGPPSARREKM